MKWFLIALSLLLGSLAAGSVYWFQKTQIRWYGETVPDMISWQSQWQQWLDDQEANLEHPAMVHLLPEGCLCRFFIQNHATELSQKAVRLGYQVYQTASVVAANDAVLLTHPIAFSTPGPLMILTNEEGQLRYLGPYSDGVRCNESNSLVDQWLPLHHTGQVIQLDATGCVCDWL